MPSTGEAFPSDVVGPTLVRSLSIPQFEPEAPLPSLDAAAFERFRAHVAASTGLELDRARYGALLLVGDGVWAGIDEAPVLATRVDALSAAAAWLTDGRYDRVADEPDRWGRPLPVDRAAARLFGQEEWSAAAFATRLLGPERFADRTLLSTRPWLYADPPDVQARGGELVQRHTDLALLARAWEDPAAPALAALHEAQALTLLLSIADPLHAIQGPGAELVAPAHAEEARAVVATLGGLLGPLRPAAPRVTAEARALYLQVQGLATAPAELAEDRSFLGLAENDLARVSGSRGAFGQAIAEALAASGGRPGSMVYSLAAQAFGPADPGTEPSPVESNAMNEIIRLQQDALQRAGTAARLWHRLLRQSIDRDDVDAVSARFAEGAVAAERDEQAHATWTPPAPPPKRDLRVLAGLLAGLAFIGFWGWMIVRSLRNLGDGGWKTPAATSAGLALLLLATPAAAVELRSPHQLALQAHANHAPFTIDQVVGPTAEQLAARNDSAATVIGYLPFWVSPSNLPWDKLDILAYFSVEVNADGSLGSDHGWGDAAALALIDEAHAAGVDVILSATRFGGSNLAPLMNSATNRANAIDNLVARMIAGNGDGLDIDFEGLNVSNRQDYVDFIVDLRVAMTAAQPGSILTQATPAIDWSGSYDYDVLADNSDYLFIMGYAFAGTWSDPQPNAPLDAGGPWGTSRSLRWSAQDYVQWGGLYNSDKFIMGLPLYGYDWEATSDAIGADEDGDVDVLFYDDFAALEAGATLGYEAVSATPYAVWQEGSQWHQMWYESPTSIAAKAEMTRDEGIGGFGFWAMNYDSNDQALWTAVGDVLDDWDGDVGDDDDDDDDDDDSTDPGDDDDDTPPEVGPTPPVLAIDAPEAVVVGTEVRIDASATTDPDGGGLGWSWELVNGPAVELAGADTATPRFIASELGVYGIRVSVMDFEGETDSGEVLVRAVPAEDADLIDDGAACACTQSAAPGGSIAALLLGIALMGWRRRR